MKFVHGVIIAIGLLVAANLAMISVEPGSMETPVPAAEETPAGAADPVMRPLVAAATEAQVMLGIGSGVPGCEETDECYIPHTVTLAAGGTVTWINDDAGHTVTAGDIVEDPGSVGTAFPNGFDSGFFLAGNSYAHTFEEAGEYPYYCMVHPWMKGVVIVQ